MSYSSDFFVHFSMEAHLHHFNMRRYEGYDQAVEDEDNGTLSIAVLFTVN